MKQKFIFTVLTMSVIFCSVSSSFCLVHTEDKSSLVKKFTLRYKNYAEEGTYENEIWFGTFFPASHYYDLFGNHLVDGYDVYGMQMGRRSTEISESNVHLSPYYSKWFNGQLVVGDFMEDRGILAMIGDRVNSFFTPFTFNQSLYSGVRLDLFAKSNFLSLVTSRISNTGTDNSVFLQDTDWLHGLHLMRLFSDDVKIGGTYMNIHHEEGGNYGNPFSGVDSDTTTVATPTGLSVYGIDYKANYLDYNISGEFIRSQRFLDGTFSPSPGGVFYIDLKREMNENLNFGGESYKIDPTFQTDFFCPAHPRGDLTVDKSTLTGRYLYSLVQDNDDNDDYPENGMSKMKGYTKGDPDGAIPHTGDRNDDTLWDYTQDFLSFETDPPKSNLYFDRNNNLVPDTIEDDAYPDYTYVPAYYLEGEKYYRYDQLTERYEEKISSGNIHKGLQGTHIYVTRNFFPEIEATIGFLMENSLEKCYHKLYDENGAEAGKNLVQEKSSNIYGILKYKKDLERKGTISVSDMIMKVNDNIPNHTVGFKIDSFTGDLAYYVIPDDLPLRNSLLNRTVVEYNFSQNRGLSLLSRLNYEIGSHSAELKYNYPGRTSGYLIFLNKCQYIYPAPWDFLKGLFIIPQYKNIYENATCRGDKNITSPLDQIYGRHAFTNFLNVVNEYKITSKTRLTAAMQFKRFDDYKNSDENYSEKNFTLQMLVNDHYRGFSMFLTLGYSNYEYQYDNTHIVHNETNNPHGVTNDIIVNEFFVKVHCGF